MDAESANENVQFRRLTWATWSVRTFALTGCVWWSNKAYEFIAAILMQYKIVESLPFIQVLPY